MNIPMSLSMERTFEAAQYIPNHKGHCKFMHGHSYRVQVNLKGVMNTKTGMLVDFGDIKNLIDRFDHTSLNDTFKMPSAENIAFYFAAKILRMNRNSVEVNVTVYETENCCATASISAELK